MFLGLLEELVGAALERKSLGKTSKHRRPGRRNAPAVLDRGHVARVHARKPRKLKAGPSALEAKTTK
jgi:hypothetical protein